MNIENNIAESEKEATEGKLQVVEEPSKVCEGEVGNDKITKSKRNPFEKILDDSLLICQASIEKDDSEINMEKLLKIFEKEVMKKEEYYLLFQLFEKTKKLQGENADSKDTQTKTNIIDIHNDLITIKNTYENKKKTLTKKVVQETEENATKEIEAPSKKKRKTNTKKVKEIVDNSEIVKKIEEMEINLKQSNEEINECQTPTKERKNSNEDMVNQIPDEEEKENKLVKIDPAQKKGRDSEKKIKQEKKEKEKDIASTNKITSFFTKKSESCFKENLNNVLSNKSKISNSMNILEKNNKIDETPYNNTLNVNCFDPYVEKINISNSADDVVKVASADEIIQEPQIPNITIDTKNLNTVNSQDMFIFIKYKPNKSLLEFDEKYIETLPFNLAGKENALNFYNIKPREISHKESDLKKYKESYRGYLNDSMIKINKKDVKRKKRILFIHDSYILLRKFNDKTSNTINPRNPFKKDDYLIDYDKDSEEELLEENAEDINSKENSADEEELNEEDEDEEKKWIVPDGHLSEDEVSEKDALVQNDLTLANSKIKSVMDLLEIRKNYTKPVVVNFNINLNINDPKIKLIGDLLKARIFNQSNSQTVNKEFFNTEDLPELPDFPIKITSKNKIEETVRKSGMNMILKDRLDEVVREIHFSFMTKEYLIKLITEKIPNISKKGLDNFFKDCCLKSKKSLTSKRTQWLVKKETLESLHITTEEFTELYNKQNQVYEEKEKERKKELQMNEENNENLLNEVRQLNNQNLIKDLPEDGPGMFNLDIINLKMKNFNNANNTSNAQSQSSQPKVTQTVFNNLFNSGQVSESKINNNTENMNNCSTMNSIKQPSQTQKEQVIDAILNNSDSVTKPKIKKSRNKQSKDGKESISTTSKKRVKSSKSKEKNKHENEEQNKNSESKEIGEKSKKSKSGEKREKSEKISEKTSEKKKTRTKNSFKKKKNDVKLDDNQATISQFNFDLNKINLGKSIKTVNTPENSDNKDNPKKENELHSNDKNE